MKTPTYEVNVYWNGGADKMGYQSDEPIDIVKTNVKKWLRNRYKRYTKLGTVDGCTLDNLEYAELINEEQGVYHELNTFCWEWDTSNEEFYSEA
jgi:hypothetical protein